MICRSSVLRTARMMQSTRHASTNPKMSVYKISYAHPAAYPPPNRGSRPPHPPHRRLPASPLQLASLRPPLSHSRPLHARLPGQRSPRSRNLQPRPYPDPPPDPASNRLHQALASPLSDRAHLGRSHRRRPPPRLRTQIPHLLQRHSPPAHPLKIKFKIVSHFLDLKTHHPKHHIHHSSHHVLTTKTPRFARVFSKTRQ